jgi:hypothetical protein
MMTHKSLKMALRWLFLLFCFGISPLLRAQINSTSTGGFWDEPATWVGATVPDMNATVQINGPVRIRGTANCRDITINGGQTLTNAGVSTLNVQNRLTNFGTIQNIDNWTFYINVGSEVQNNGTYNSSHLIFNGTGICRIGGPGVFIVRNFDREHPGRILATSPLNFGAGTSAQLYNDTLVMGNNKLTAVSTIDNMFSGSQYSGGDPYAWIQSEGEIDISGPFRMNVLGNPILTGRDPMRLLVTIVAENLRIAPSKEVNNYGLASLQVKGTLTNEGIIRAVDNWGFTIYSSNRCQLNGTFAPTALIYKGKVPVYLGGSALLNMGSLDREENGRIIANSALSFGESASGRFEHDTLVMGNFKLTAISTDDRFFNGSSYSGGDPYAWIQSEGEIDISGPFRMNLLGRPTLIGTGTMRIVVSIVAERLTIAKGKTVTNSGISTLKTSGWFVNDGILEARGNWAFYHEVRGQYQNNGRSSGIALYVYPEDELVQLMGQGSFQGNIETRGTGRVELLGLFDQVQNVIVAEGAPLTIMPNGRISLIGWYNLSGPLTNQGQLRVTAPIANNMATNLPAIFGFQLNTGIIGGPDTLEITQYGNQSHPRLAQSSLKGWWKVKGKRPVMNYWLRLNYLAPESGLDENRIHAFTAPEAADWMRISNPVNITRNIEANSLTIGNGQALITTPLDELVLSTSSIAVLPDVGIAMMGPENIRVGPPNRYTLTYWNNSDVATPSLLIYFQPQGGIWVHNLHTTNAVTGERMILNRDSLGLDDPNDDLLLLTTLPMAPGEVRSFELYLNATRDKVTLVEPVSWYFVGVGVVMVGSYAAVKIGEWIATAQLENCDEWIDKWDKLDAPTQQKVWEIFRTCTQKKVDDWQNDIAEGSAIKSIEIMMRTSLPGVDIGVSGIKCMGKMFQWLTKSCRIMPQGNKVADEVEEAYARLLAQHGGQSITCQHMAYTKITSWDPNAKYGPAGTQGEHGYIRKGQPMTYRLAFENVDTAKAPAWRVIITDTLDATKLDPETVDFKSMSHPMGVPTRNGNILHWTFEGIELPPNQNPPQGEGWVEFTVQQRNNTKQGDVIRNRASIVFDLNPPMLTNTVVNTIDVQPPVTTPTGAYRIKGDKEHIDVVWKANDVGSGVDQTYVYAIIDSMPPKLIGISDSTATRVVFNPDEKRPFRIFVQSKDRVGNMEAQNAVAIMEIKEPSSRENADAGGIERSLQVWPNPVQGQLNAQFECPAGTEWQVQLFDLAGKSQYSQSGKRSGAGLSSVQIPVENLSGGMYVLRLQVGEQQANRKVMCEQR